MIQAAESDIIGPAIAAVHPESLLGQLIPIPQDCLGLCILQRFKRLNQLLAGMFGSIEIIEGFQPRIHGRTGRQVCTLCTVCLNPHLLRFALMLD